MEIIGLVPDYKQDEVQLFSEYPVKIYFEKDDIHQKVRLFVNPLDIQEIFKIGIKSPLLK